MAASSSVQSCDRRPTPFIPLVGCPDCGKEVQRRHSNTVEHEGWIFYQCKTHKRGWSFWHCDLQYVICLMETGYIMKTAEAETFGWAEERREQLELKKKQADERRGQLVQDESLKNSIVSVGEQLTEAVALMKLVVALMVVGCLLLVQKN